MPGPMDYGLNLELNLALGESSVNEVVRSISDIHKQLNDAVAQAMGKLGVSVEQDFQKIGKTLRPIRIDFDYDVETIRKHLESLTPSSKYDIVLDPKSVGELQTMARLIGDISFEQMMDPGVIEQAADALAKIKLVISEADKLGLSLREQNKLAVQHDVFVGRLRTQYRNMNKGLIEAIMKIKEARTKQKVLTDKELDNYREMVKKQRELSDITTATLNLTKEQQREHKKLINLLEKETTEVADFSHELEGIKRAARALGLEQLMRLSDPIEAATFALAALKNAFVANINRQEQFHATNYRLYGSMRELSRATAEIASSAGVTRQEVTAAYMALADVAVPREAMRGLAEQNAELARVTGASNHAIAQLQGTFVAMTGDIKEGTRIASDFVVKMRAMGLAGRDFEDVARIIGERAVYMQKSFGPEAPRQFAVALSNVIIEAKKLGDTARRDIIGFASKLNTEVAVPAVAIWGEMGALQMSAADQMAIMSLNAGKSIERLNALSAKGTHMQRRAMLQATGMTDEMFEAMARAGKKAAASAGFDYEKYSKGQIELTQKQREAYMTSFKTNMDNENAIAKARDESNRNLARQWQTISDAASAVLEIVLEPISMIASLVGSILAPVAKIVRFFAELADKLGFIGSIIKTYFAFKLIGFLLRMLGVVKFGIADLTARLMRMVMVVDKFRRGPPLGPGAAGAVGAAIPLGGTPTIPPTAVPGAETARVEHAAITNEQRQTVLKTTTAVEKFGAGLMKGARVAGVVGLALTAGSGLVKSAMEWVGFSKEAAQKTSDIMEGIGSFGMQVWGWAELFRFLKPSQWLTKIRNIGPTLSKIGPWFARVLPTFTKAFSFVVDKIRTIGPVFTRLGPWLTAQFSRLGPWIGKIGPKVVGLFGRLGPAVARVGPLLARGAASAIGAIGPAAGAVGTALSALAPVAAVVGAAIAGWKIGRWIDEVTGVGKVFTNLGAKVLKWWDGEDKAAKAAAESRKKILQKTGADTEEQAAKESKASIVMQYVKMGKEKEAADQARQFGMTINEARKTVESSKAFSQMMSKQEQTTRTATMSAQKELGRAARLTSQDIERSKAASQALAKQEQTVRASTITAQKGLGQAMIATAAEVHKIGEIAPAAVTTTMQKEHEAVYKPAGASERPAVRAETVVPAKITETTGQKPEENKVVKTLMALHGILTSIDSKVNLEPLSEIAGVMSKTSLGRDPSQAGLAAPANQWHQAR